MKTKRLIVAITVAVSLALPFTIMPAYAANVSITGGTNGAACDSGGYFTPSSLTINSGDTVTISVPANDPYPDGLEVHGFPQGSFVIARGSSVTTNAITANVSYYGTWPSSGCMKGSGTITVSVPAASPPSPTPAPMPPSTPPTPSPVTQPSTPTATNTPTSTTPATTPKTSSQTPTNHGANNTPTPSSSSNATLKMIALVGGSALTAIVVVLVVVWRMIIRRR